MSQNVKGYGSSHKVSYNTTSNHEYMAVHRLALRPAAKLVS